MSDPQTSQNQYLFMGQYRHALDPKKRLTIPSEWRAELMPETKVAVLPGFDRKCLLLMPASSVKARMQESLGKHSMNDTNARRFASMVGRLSCQAPFDSQGRIRISDELLNSANLTSEVVLIGAFDSIELWNPEDLDNDASNGPDISLGDAAKGIGF